jgi:hypothetical protein
MKRLLGLAALILSLSVPAHAQRMGGSGGVINGGGSGGGGGVGLGAVNIPGLPGHPPRDFLITSVSGSESDFTPSTFLSYDEAIAEGRAALAARSKTLAECATESRNSERDKAKIAFLQDANGRAFLAPQ